MTQGFGVGEACSVLSLPALCCLPLPPNPLRVRRKEVAVSAVVMADLKHCRRASEGRPFQEHPITADSIHDDEGTCQHPLPGWHRHGASSDSSSPVQSVRA